MAVVPGSSDSAEVAQHRPARPGQRDALELEEAQTEAGASCG